MPWTKSVTLYLSLQAKGSKATRSFRYKGTGELSTADSAKETQRRSSLSASMIIEND